MKSKTTLFKFFAVIVCTILIGFFIIFFKPQPKKTDLPFFSPPSVSVISFQPISLAIPVFSRGRVKTTREYKITSSVEGLVKSINDNLIEGATVNKNDVLLKIDAQPLVLDVAKKQADLDNAKLHLEETKAKAKVARKSTGKNATEYARYIPQITKADSQVMAAEAALTYANEQLKNATIKAPITGKLIDVFIQPGDLLQRATQIAVVYDLNQLEIRLPLNDKQLSVIGLKSLDDSAFNQFQVELTEFNHQNSAETSIWSAEIVRVEGLKSENQLIYVIAKINLNNKNQKSLLPGSFLEAKILGQEKGHIFSASREVIQPDETIWYLDNNNSAQSLPINIIHRGKKNIYFRANLEEGTKIITSNFAQLAEGMKVNPISNIEN